MTQQPETFIVGNREFTCLRMNAFDANRLLLRIQKIAVPLLGSMIGSGKGLGDVDVKQAAMMIAEHLDESLMDTLVLPMFAQSRTYCVGSKKFVSTANDINVVFTAENLFDMYELIFEVARFQFGPFFASLAVRFGSLTTAEATT
jgi:hypothetical protein